MPRRGLWIAGGLFVALVALPMLRYGSLRPCEMLRQDLRTAFRTAAGRMAKQLPADQIDKAARALGALMATAIADPVIDQLVVPLNPFECARLVVRLKVDPEGALDDLARVRR